MRRKSIVSMIVLSIFVLTTVGTVLADDGQIFRRNISKTPTGETERAAMTMLGFYVPAQNSTGELVEIEYYDAEEALVETRDMAKPLISVYIDNQVEEEHDDAEAGMMGGVAMGQFDAFGAHSLDDGATWKRVNLTNSSDLSSFTLKDGHEYPGDAHYVTFAAAGNRVMAAVLSKYCTGGDANYTLDDTEREELATYLGIEVDDIYLNDLFGVAGAQKSVDYTAQGWPEVGEIPYSCMWTIRGTLELDADTGLYDIVWRKPERLTSGRRDANRVEVMGEVGAGFIMTWQEDPEGLRPGQGLGPGEGWSGAIVNQKTDVWYSYISWKDFDKVKTSESDATPIPLEAYIGETQPKVGVPMAVPIRVSDNNMCKHGVDEGAQGYQAYCYEDFDGNGTADLCESSVSWETPGGSSLDICVAEDGRVLWGRTGASRPRINLRAYDQDGDGVNDSAWVLLGYEELKALGEGMVEDGGDEEVEPIDIGKNIWYQSFDMFNPDIVAQGGMINHPAKDPETGLYFEMLEDDWGNPFYETEIARRFNLMSQYPSKDDSYDLTAVLIYKMGIINQGGPADIFLRRIVLPDDFDPQVDNPYAYKNIDCETWEYTDASNPRYLEGLCKDTGINVSATNIVECDAGTPDYCVENFPWDGSEDIVNKFPKITQWEQTVDNLDDETWENPYDVSKGHRGFMDGDFVMFMYAWSPNWKANSVGNDKYNLYVRRSFDEGLTWTTTPADLGGTGTCHTENYLNDAVGDEGAVETCYAVGAFEQARNLSQFAGTKETVLDPRYSPSGGVRKFAEINTMADGTSVTPYEDDIRDPSIFFMVYETGDNTTSAVGEATPMDLFYSRATVWGDVYDWVEKEVDGEVVEEWDWLEHDRDDLSGEASVTANPGGTFFYAVWNQWKEDIGEDGHEHIYDSDAIFRRVMYLDNIDVDPTATILATSHSSASQADGDVLTFVGSARDNDHQNGVGGADAIVDYVWESDLDGVLSTDQVLTVDAGDLSIGLHTLTFSAQDDEGNIAEASTNLFVAYELFRTYMPLVLR